MHTIELGDAVYNFPLFPAFNSHKGALPHGARVSRICMCVCACLFIIIQRVLEFCIFLYDNKARTTSRDGAFAA